MSEETTNENPVATMNDLPQWAQDEITNTRAEAAKYRTQKNEAVEAAKAELAESYTEKIQALEAQIAEAQDGEKNSRTEVEKLKTAINAGIQHDKILGFADLLKGETPEELVSHADELKSLFTTVEQPKATKSPATDPSQGQGGEHLPLNGDQLLQSVMRVVNK